MPIRRTLEGRNFEPKAAAMLVEAFDRVVADLDLRTDADRKMAAKIVIELGRHSDARRCKSTRRCGPLDEKEKRRRALDQLTTLRRRDPANAEGVKRRASEVVLTAHRNSAIVGPFTTMIAITITSAAYEALKVMRPQTYDTPAGPDGMVRIWLDRKFVEQLGQMKGPGESYSHVILRLAEGDGGEE